MGNGINDSSVVCKDDGRCTYAPSPGSGPGHGFADFHGESPVGDWLLCLADGHVHDSGTLQAATLTVLAW
jgi:subtilisin-like proprotein convertase family protein